MPKTQITYVYASNLKSRSNEFKHGKVIIPIPGDITPNKDGITDTKSILQALDLLGSAGMFIFMGIISQPFPDPTLRCVDGKGRIYEEGDTAPGSICVKCRNGIWTHNDTLDPCGGWHEGVEFNVDTGLPQIACVKTPNHGCKVCGNCKKCLGDEGNPSCIALENAEWNKQRCIECIETRCGQEPDYRSYCEEQGLSCCYGECYDSSTECIHLDYEGTGFCAVGCPDGYTCVQASLPDGTTKPTCVDYIPTQSLTLIDNLMP